MTLRFHGDPNQYKDIIHRVSRHRHWHEPSNNCVRCDLDRGVVVHWWWETGTVLFQGPQEAASRMKANFLVLAGDLALFIK
jgi:hypothetical protein